MTSSASAVDVRGFRQLTWAWVPTNIADSLIFLVAAIWVKDLTGSNAAAGLTFVMVGAPALAAPFLGQLADRVSRRTILAVSNAIMVPVMGSLLWVREAHHAWVLLIALLCYGTMNYLTAAAQGGLLRDLLDDARLASGNGILTSVDQSLRLGAPLAGTAAYVAWGPQVVVITTMVLFAVAVPLFMRVDVTEASRPVPTESQMRELFAGFRHLALTAPLGVATVVIAAGFSAAGLVNVAVFPIIEQGLSFPTAALGFLVPLQGVGAIVGGLTAARIIARYGEMTTIVLGQGLLALSLLPAALTQNRILVIGGFVLIGCAVSWIVVAYMTMRQVLTPPHLQGRTASAANVAINVPQLVGTVVATSLVGMVDYRLLVAGTIIMCLVAAVLGAVVTARRAAATRQSRQTVTPQQTSMPV